jgi:hypothetical protein
VTLSVLIVGVADEVVVPALSVIRLFVSVFVELIVGTAAPPIVAPVVKSGEVPNTRAPLPVSPVTAVARFALDGVARNVATPEPSPLTPVPIGSPVAFVKVAADGVPRLGVVRAGEVPNTSDPLPVSSVTAVARFALDGVASAVATPDARPLTPVLIGSPVAFVKVPADGVPRFGVVRVGDACITNVDPVPV